MFGGENKRSAPHRYSKRKTLTPTFQIPCTIHAVVQNARSCKIHAFSNHLFFHSVHFFNYMRFLMSLVLYQALGPLAGEKRNIIRAKAHFVPSFKAHLLAELPPTRRGGAAGLRTVNRDRNPPFQARVLLLLRPDPGREEAARRDGGGQPGVR